MILSLLFSVAFAQTNIALNWKAEPQFGGFYQAELNKELPLKMQEGGSGTPTAQMLGHGTTQYAVVSAEEIIISNERNPKTPLVAVFAVFQTNPQVWITKADRKLKSIQEIMETPGVVAAQSGLTYVEFIKRKYPNAKIKWAPYTGGISALQSKAPTTQQGFATSEPLLAEKAGLKVSTFLIADEGFNPYTTVLAVRKSDLEKNKAEIEKVVKAVKKGWLDYLKDPTAANKYMAQINNAIDAETFIKSAAAQKTLIETKEIGSMDLARWQALLNTLRDLKVIKKDLKAEDQFVNF